MSQREEDRMNAADASIQRRASAVLVDFFFITPSERREEGFQLRGLAQKRGVCFWRVHSLPMTSFKDAHQ